MSKCESIGVQICIKPLQCQINFALQFAMLAALKKRKGLAKMFKRQTLWRRGKGEEKNSILN